MTIILVILASQESLSAHFKAEYIHFYMNGVSVDIDSLLEHSNKKTKCIQFPGTPCKSLGIHIHRKIFYSFPNLCRKVGNGGYIMFLTDGENEY